MKQVDCRPLIGSLAIQAKNSDETSDDDNESSHNGVVGVVTNFNERVVRVMCLNQAIERYERELAIIKDERDKALIKM